MRPLMLEQQGKLQDFILDGRDKRIELRLEFRMENDFPFFVRHI